MISKDLQNQISSAFDDGVLIKIFTKSTGLKDVTVENVVVRASATNKGDSYLSSVVRFSLEGTGKNKYVLFQYYFLEVLVIIVMFKCFFSDTKVVKHRSICG